jgi:hypothetical protein
MTDAFLCDAIRTPIGRLNGALSGVRADDLAAIPIKALIDRKAGVDWWRSTRIFDLAQNRQGSDRRYGADGMRANQGLGHAEKPADFVQSDLGAPLTLALSAPFQRDVLEGRGNRVLAARIGEADIRPDAESESAVLAAMDIIKAPELRPVRSNEQV